MTPSGLMPRRTWPSAASFAAAAMVGVIAVAGCGSSNSKSNSSSTSTTATAPSSTAAGFTTQSFASGVPITLSTPSGPTSITQPDDITSLGGHIFVAFQNGVGPQGEPTPSGTAGTGNRDSTIVDFSGSGTPTTHWNVAGHVDGLTANPSTGQVVVTANEDANARLYVIDPGSSQVVSYQLPSLPSGGGLDAISFYHGMMLISASAPGTSGKAPPQASYPAIYVVTLNTSAHTASVRGLFGDEAAATPANPGGSGTTHLALTDPDSNAVVPASAQRFGGDFELTSQGDYEEIFMSGTSGQQLSVLKLSQSIDDSAWAPSSSGTLYVTDASADLVYKITGAFGAGEEIVGVTPCDAGNAPKACPAPGFPSNYLGVADQSTGAVSKFPGNKDIQPAGLLFVS